MDSEKVSVFDNEYFGMNKKLLLLIGLWPNATFSSKIFKRILIVSFLVLVALPNISGVFMWCGKDLPLCGENVAALMYALAILAKFVNTVIFDIKIKYMYQLLEDKWLTINDAEEVQILKEYAQMGKNMGLAYTTFEVAAGLVFSQTCMINTLLDCIYPLNESRPKILPVNGEYPFDPFKHHFMIYLAYTTIAAVTICIFLGLDNMYVAIVHQSLALFGIVQHRLKKALNYYAENKDLCYNTIISAILMHRDVLQLSIITSTLVGSKILLTGIVFQRFNGCRYLDVIETSYGICWLGIISMSAILLSIGAIVIFETIDQHVDLLNFLKFSMTELGIALHLFYLSWPGQKVIDHSEELFWRVNGYEWYNVDKQGKILIKLMILKCTRTCKLTTCGFYTLSFKNFADIIKTTMSYFMALISFRK